MSDRQGADARRDAVPGQLSAIGALGRELWSRCSPSRTHSRKGRIGPQNMKRDGTIVPPRSELPLLGSNQDSPDPMPLRLSPPPVRRAFVVWTVPSPSPLRGQAAPTQSLHLPLTGLGSALPVKGSPTSRAFTHVVSDVVSSECTRRAPLESGVLPVTPRGNAIWISGIRLRQAAISFYARPPHAATGGSEPRRSKRLWGVRRGPERGRWTPAGSFDRTYRPLVSPVGGSPGRGPRSLGD